MLLRRLSPLATIFFVIIIFVALFSIRGAFDYPIEVTTVVFQWNIFGGILDNCPNVVLQIIAIFLLVLISVQCSRISLLSIFYLRSRNYISTIFYSLFVVTYLGNEVNLSLLLGIFIGTMGIMQGLKIALLKSGMAVRRLFTMSFFMGLSILIYPPMIWFNPIVMLSLLFIRSFEPREYLAALLSIFLPALFYLYVVWILHFDVLIVFDIFLSSTTGALGQGWGILVDSSFDLSGVSSCVFVRSLCSLAFSITAFISVFLGFFGFLVRRSHFKRRGQHSVLFFTLLSSLCLCYLFLLPLPTESFLLICFVSFSIILPLYFSLERKRKVLAFILELMLILSSLSVLFSPFFLASSS